MVTESTKQSLKQVGWNLGTMGTIIGTYYTLYYSDILQPLRDITFFEYELAQILFMFLIAAAIGSIFAPVLLKQKDLDTAVGEFDDLIGKATNSSEKQVEHFKEEIKDEAESRVKGIFTIFKKKERSTREIAEFGVVTPNEIRSNIMAIKKSMMVTIGNARNGQTQTMGVYAVDASTDGDVEPLRIIPPTEIDTSDVMVYEDYRKRNLIILLVVAALSALSLLIGYLVKTL